MLMSDYWHDLHLASSFSGHGAAPLGPEYLMNDAGNVSLVSTHSGIGSGFGTLLTAGNSRRFVAIGGNPDLSLKGRNRRE